MKSFTCTASLIVALAACATAARATEDVLPDDRAVTQQCAALRDVAAGQPAIALAYQRIDAECNHYKTSRNAEAFFADTYEPAKQIRDFLEPPATTDPVLHAAKNFTAGQPIPTGKAYYVLFLVTARDWGTPKDLADLHTKFEEFGYAIGDDRLAIWFRGPSGASSVDTRRAKDYFDKFGLGKRLLGYGDGPFIVATSVRPDRWNNSSPIVIASLKNMSPANVPLLLNALEQDLRNKVDPNQGRIAFLQVAGELTTFVKNHPNLIAQIGTFLVTGSFGK